MPRRKPSEGLLVFTTVFPEEFQRFLHYELYNSNQWNKETSTIEMGLRRWKYYRWVRGRSKKEPLFTIEWNGSRILVESQEPVLYIRKGLAIEMGNGRMIVDGTTP